MEEGDGGRILSGFFGHFKIELSRPKFCSSTRFLEKRDYCNAAAHSILEYHNYGKVCLILVNLKFQGGGGGGLGLGWLIEKLSEDYFICPKDFIFSSIVVQYNCTLLVFSSVFTIQLYITSLQSCFDNSYVTPTTTSRKLNFLYDRLSC